MVDVANDQVQKYDTGESVSVCVTMQHVCSIINKMYSMAQLVKRMNECKARGLITADGRPTAQPLAQLNDATPASTTRTTRAAIGELNGKCLTLKVHALGARCALDFQVLLARTHEFTRRLLLCTHSYMVDYT